MHLFRWIGKQYLDAKEAFQSEPWWRVILKAIISGRIFYYILLLEFPVMAVCLILSLLNLVPYPEYNALAPSAAYNTVRTIRIFAGHASSILIFLLLTVVGYVIPLHIAEGHKKFDLYDTLSPIGLILAGVVLWFGKDFALVLAQWPLPFISEELPIQLQILDKMCFGYAIYSAALGLVHLIVIIGGGALLMVAGAFVKLLRLDKTWHHVKYMLWDSDYNMEKHSKAAVFASTLIVTILFTLIKIGVVAGLIYLIYLKFL
jgi:hypothetical protein